MRRGVSVNCAATRLCVGRGRNRLQTDVCAARVSTGCHGPGPAIPPGNIPRAYRRGRVAPLRGPVPARRGQSPPRFGPAFRPTKGRRVVRPPVHRWPVFLAVRPGSVTATTFSPGCAIGATGPLSRDRVPVSSNGPGVNTGHAAHRRTSVGASVPVDDQNRGLSTPLHPPRGMLLSGGLAGTPPARSDQGTAAPGPVVPRGPLGTEHAPPRTQKARLGLQPGWPSARYGNEIVTPPCAAAFPDEAPGPARGRRPA